MPRNTENTQPRLTVTMVNEVYMIVWIYRWWWSQRH